MSRLALVVNPVSGHGRGRRLTPRIEQRLRASGAEVATTFTTSLEHARRTCEDAVSAGVDGLVVVGGDGMAHLGINACARTDVPLGVVPAGTGNDFCRGVGVPGRWADAVDAIARGGVETIDLVEVTGELYRGGLEYVGCIVSTGYDERVNARANAQPVDLGTLSYLWAIVGELRSFAPLRYRIELDGVAEELDAVLVAVANTGWFGGGIRIAPQADPADGLLDVVIVHPVSPRVLLEVFPRLASGRPIDHPCIEYRRVRRAVVDGPGLRGMADGEPLGIPPLTCSVAPGALRVLT